MNTVNLVGNLTHEIELKKTQKGDSVVNFSIAVKRRFSKDKTDFIEVTAWRHTAEFLSNYVRKGQRLGVVGRLEVNQYENQQGQKIKKYVVVADQVDLLETKIKSNNQQGGYSQPRQQTVQEERVSTLDIGADDLPF